VLGVSVSAGFDLKCFGFLMLNFRFSILFNATLGGQDVTYTGMCVRSHFLAYVVGRVISLLKNLFREYFGRVA